MTEDKEDHQSEGKGLKSISVVISCLNESENISKCIHSTLAQKGRKNWEINITLLTVFGKKNECEQKSSSWMEDPRTIPF